MSQRSTALYCRVGVYMLTEPYGLDYITHCEEEGFHTHPKEPPLYEVEKDIVNTLLFIVCIDPTVALLKVVVWIVG